MSLMNYGQIEVEITRLYAEIERAVEELGAAGETAAKLDLHAEREYDKVIINLDAEFGKTVSVAVKEARARSEAYEARLAAKLADRQEKVAKANLSRIQSQLDVLRTLMSSLRNV